MTCNSAEKPAAVKISIRRRLSRFFFSFSRGACGNAGSRRASSELPIPNNGEGAPTRRTASIPRREFRCSHTRQPAGLSRSQYNACPNFFRNPPEPSLASLDFSKRMPRSAKPWGRGKAFQKAETRRGRISALVFVAHDANTSRLRQATLTKCMREL